MSNPPPTVHKRVRRSIHEWLTVSLQAILAIAVLWSVLEGQWMNVVITSAILVLTLLPRILGKRFAVFIPPEFEAATIVFLFASLFLGEVGGYYAKFWWWDVVLHSGSAILLGILGLLLVYILNRDPRIDLSMTPGFIALFAFVFAVAIGALWEIFEFAMDNFFAMNMQKSGLVDTMWDLIVDTLGALIVSITGYRTMCGRTTSFIERWITAFIVGNPRLFDLVNPDEK